MGARALADEMFRMAPFFLRTDRVQSSRSALSQKTSYQRCPYLSTIRGRTRLVIWRHRGGGRRTGLEGGRGVMRDKVTESRSLSGGVGGYLAHGGDVHVDQGVDELNQKHSKHTEPQLHHSRSSPNGNMGQYH